MWPKPNKKIVAISNLNLDNWLYSPVANMNYLTELTGDVSDFDCQLHDCGLVNYTF